MDKQEIYEENKKILKWAAMSEQEFLFRYFEKATVEELMDFLEENPDFMDID